MMPHIQGVDNKLTGMEEARKAVAARTKALRAELAALNEELATVFGTEPPMVFGLPLSALPGYEGAS